MYTVLIIDDENTTREFLKDYLPWEKLDYGDIFLATNGQEGAEIAIREKPDLIISDIKMPKMDGVEMLKFIREKCPDTKVVFISAYTEKDYLMSAIKLGAIDFIEKPLDIELITNLLISITDRIKLDKENKEYLYNQGRFLRDLCAVTGNKQNAPKELIDKFNLLKYDSYTVFLLSSKNKDHLKIFLELFSECYGRKYHTVISEKYNVNHSPIILLLASNCSNIGFTENLKKLNNIIDENKLEIICTYSEPVLGIEQIPSAYKFAVEFDKYKFYQLGYGVFEIKNLKHLPYTFDLILLDEIKSAFQQKDYYKVSSCLHKFSSDVCKAKPEDINYVKNNFFKIIGEIDSFLLSQDLFIQTDEEENTSYIWHLVAGFESVKQFCNYILSIASTVCSKDNLYSNDKAINVIVRYVENNLSNPDLSVGLIAEHVHLTPSYLCQIFRKSVNVTLNNYITNVRIKRAKHLLLNTDMPINKIFPKVGYSDSKYFSKVFSGKVGVSPANFRRGNI